ncbi:MAG: 1-acyl-sn-glycerol-3-phosphate acyltransferase [Emcibacter sp.]|nr:1-acyl-sn-glycerol-3-phosphate acyltransferase [Emcibacter sp.]
MSEIVELKFWHFIALLLLATYGLLQLVILPLIQKFIYRRFQATERILDEELDFGLPSYALANRRLWIDRLLSDPDVKNIIKKTIQEDDRPAHKVLKEARDYANEIVPSFNAFLYFRLGYWLSKIFLRMFYWIKVGYRSEHDYQQITKDDCVVLVSNHRSNFDPLLLIYMTSQRAPISYAAGEWAPVFPFRQLLHAFGFYIIRRDRSGDKLYHCLLQRYVFLATSQCVPQGLFIEGGLSRDGQMQPMKLGLLNYLLKANKEGNCRDIVFIPAALNYDRIPEFKTLIAHQDKGFEDKSRFYTLLSFIRFVATVTTYMLPRRHKPFGYSCVNFGVPISLNKWQQENAVDINNLDPSARREVIDKLGQELTGRISSLIPILPTNILAKVFEESTDLPLSEIELKVRATEIIKQITKKDGEVFLPKNDEDYALSQGIYILIREKIIQPTGDGRFTLVKGSQKMLAYYCNIFSDTTT